jgi:hypothetical protein
MAERLGKDAFSWLPPERQLAALQVPEAMGAAAAGVLGHHMAAILEQALAAELEQGGAADREAAAGLLSREPERIVHGGSNDGCCLGQRERLPKWGGKSSHSIGMWQLPVSHCNSRLN